LKLAAVAAAGLAVTALVNHQAARRAERRNPPKGAFLDVRGVRLHYLMKGRGEPVVFLHGNGSMVEDFETSGVLDLAAAGYRVIALDRPGYGHSSRPRGRIWTAEAQADLIHEALRRLGVARAVVLGHSWGTLVALALAARHPSSVKGLVLASGYYFPTMRFDVIALSPPAMPIIGDLIRYTVSPVAARLMWPALKRKIFGPAPVPVKFGGFPKEMTFRPSQLKASAAESALMIPEAGAAMRRYDRLAMPVAIIAGDGDRLIDPEAQSVRLHHELPGSTLRLLPGVGHMVHQTAPAAVMEAIDEVVARADTFAPVETFASAEAFARAETLARAETRARAETAERASVPT
jgi:pimeloyl-ACP methyl ester carboxylesterase